MKLKASSILIIRISLTTNSTSTKREFLATAYNIEKLGMGLGMRLSMTYVIASRKMGTSIQVVL